MTGRINSIQTLGTLDGPGVRFVLFVQGCPLRCAYCHNPDTWDFSGGTETTAEDIFRKVKRYKEYYKDDGGITVSGGEPLMQAEFVAELFELCKNDGINTCLDTSGCIWNEKIDRLLSVTDMVLLDFKMTDNEQYRKYIGCEKENVERFLCELETRSIPTWLRQVIVTGINDTPDSAGRLYDIADRHSCVKKVELLKFRKICKPKYDNLGIEFPFGDKPETTDEQIRKLNRY